ncbi:response regulator transcription factor [Nocardioides fonticola]|uniref:Response regulator transcription factor n=1 Tax=Nocardioides fonticola TaxID=450363 RepID=A0ABP7XFL7_9ACTN
MTPHGLRRPLIAQLLDDYPVTHAGLRLLLQPFEARVRLLERPSDPDVVLYEPARLSTSQRLRLRELQTLPHCVQVAYSWDDRQAHHPFIGKHVPVTQLVARLEELVRQRRRSEEEHTPHLAGPKLSPRESQVLALVGQGLTNIEIGERLGLSINSVKTYIRSGYRKIGVNRRSQAVSWCLQHGLIGGE